MFVALDCKYCIVLYCIVLYCIVLYCIVLYCIVLYCIVLYCIVLYCIIPYQLCFYIVYLEAMLTSCIIQIMRYFFELHVCSKALQLITLVIGNI